EHPEQEYTSGNFERSTGEACVLISASPLNNYFLSHYRKRRHCRKNRQCPLHALRVNCQLGGKIAQVNPSLFRLRPDWIHAIQPGGIAAQYHVLLFGADVTASENVVDPDLGLRESIHSGRPSTSLLEQIWRLVHVSVVTKNERLHPRVKQCVIRVVHF